jgi:hypothetical protein
MAGRQAFELMGFGDAEAIDVVTKDSSKLDLAGLLKNLSNFLVQARVGEMFSNTRNNIVMKIRKIQRV